MIKVDTTFCRHLNIDIVTLYIRKGFSTKLKIPQRCHLAEKTPLPGLITRSISASKTPAFHEKPPWNLLFLLIVATVSFFMKHGGITLKITSKSSPQCFQVLDELKGP